MESLIPASKISTLTQGMFVGAVADNFNERIEQKIFHCEIVVDAEKVKREEQAYKPIPVITDFTDADGNDRMKETIQENYNRIRAEVRQIVADELQRIQSDPSNTPQAKRGKGKILFNLFLIFFKRYVDRRRWIFSFSQHFY